MKVHRIFLAIWIYMMHVSFIVTYLYFFSILLSLAELPSVSAGITKYKCCHRFISGSRLQLIVGAILLFALAALEHLCFRALNGGLCTENCQNI
jgi:hypothetical protein